MTIIEKIENSIQRQHGDDFHVYYHNEPTLNLLAEEMDFPCAVVQLLVSGIATVANGQARETVPAAVFFVEPSEFDFGAKENEVIIDRCKTRAFAWLLALQTDVELELEAIERTQRVYEQFDAILTGYAVMVRLKELKGITDC